MKRGNDLRSAPLHQQKLYAIPVWIQIPRISREEAGAQGGPQEALRKSIPRTLLLRGGNRDEGPLMGQPLPCGFSRCHTHATRACRRMP